MVDNLGNVLFEKQPLFSLRQFRETGKHFLYMFCGALGVYSRFHFTWEYCGIGAGGCKLHTDVFELLANAVANFF